MCGWLSGNGAEMQRNTGYFPTESLEPSGNRLFSRSALNEGYLFRGSLSQVKNYYVAAGFTDLRRGIDGLAAIVTQQFGHELSEDSLFMFCGRRTDRIKALYYSGDGYVLIYKRLTNGSFQWPRTETELRLLDARSFRWLMEGLKIDQPKAIRKRKKRDLF